MQDNIKAQDNPDDVLRKSLERELETSSEDKDGAAKKASQATQPTKVKVGEEEIDADELAKLIEKGRLAGKIEVEQNLDLKELYPDYTRKSQLLKNPDKLKDYMSSQFGESSTQQPLKTANDGSDNREVEMTDEVRGEIAKARKIGFLTREDVDDIVQKAVKVSSAFTKAEIKLEDRLEELSEKYDGSENSPIPGVKFDKGSIVQYIIDNYSGAKNVPDPEQVFKLINLDTITKTAGRKVESDAKPPVTEKAGSTGTRVPAGRAVPSFKDEAALRKYLEEEITKEQVEI